MARSRNSMDQLLDRVAEGSGVPLDGVQRLPKGVRRSKVYGGLPHGVLEGSKQLLSWVPGGMGFRWFRGVPGVPGVERLDGVPMSNAGEASGFRCWKKILG